MKTLTVALLFALSLVAVLAPARADARSLPPTESRMARPLALAEGEDDKRDPKDDEEDEEEYRPR